MEIVFYIVPVIALLNLFLELKRDLMMLQQNSYRNERYMRWLKNSQDTTSMPRLTACVVLGFSISTYCPTNVAMYLIILFAVFNSARLLRAKYKKPLVFTNRARRIYGVAVAISVIVIAGISVAVGDLNKINSILSICGFAGLFLYIASHMVIYAANVVLAPVEKNINKKYYNDAARILASMPDLKIIGITGSYGKTSTKHYLHRILSEKYDVLMTPGSYNTTLGVIRTVREYLKPYNEVFIVEMGAKQQGDIKEICDLVKPHMGIVTAVGEQHLESFKSIENVQSTKFELIDALPQDGVGVVNDDFEYVANREVKNVECIRYAVNETKNASYTAKDITYDETGTRFTVVGGGKELQLHTKLVGECNISNLIAAVIIALRLDVPEDKIRYAVEKIEQVEHRLNLKRTPGGITIIDDAFNSNPTGSKMAMDVLSRFNKGKRIVITPGMIELGEKQYELNEALGVKIAECADVAIIVGEYNKEALLGGIKQGKMNSENVHAVASFNEAQQVLATIARAGDTVLYENDLPDTFK
ncbi:MAG: UDP-N-acetylmuramoyl-tripeptide--D-alanyl-D-alanine ligase [Muribaculaceae bacterium]|nr:UDP-N-acetylmuramoyl-tripeptide--D-alanyl-D-alanine ligase [Muribaculaceae bacterium]